MDPDIIKIILTFLTVSGGLLSAAVGKMFLWVNARMILCEADRKELGLKIDTDRLAYALKIEELTDKIIAMSDTMKRVDDHLEFIDTRHEDDKPKQGK